MSQQFDLSATKYGVVNPIYNAYKQVVPANARLLVKSLLNPSPVTEQNFTPQELSLLKQTYSNSLNRSNSPMALNAKNRANILMQQQNSGMLEDNAMIPSLNKNIKSNIPANQEIYDILPSMYSQSIQYTDYPKDKFNLGDEHPILSTLLSPSYRMGTTIGRANYNIDPQGNVHINDNYNFGKIDPSAQADFNKLSPLYQLAEKIGNRFGGQMPVDINLGNVK